MTTRNYDPEHRVDYWQARCTNCGHICDDYGEFAAFGDADQAIEQVTAWLDWYSRWTYTPNPTPDNPRGRTATLVELLCPNCQECEICESKNAYDIDDHLVCEDHEDHDFS